MKTLSASIIFFLLVILNQSCLNQDCSKNANSLSEDEKLADSILRKVALKLKEDKNLWPCGTIGQKLNKIEVLGLGFNYYESISVEEARRLLIYCVNEFIKTVNQDEKIRPYLSNYPFEPKNIEIDIFMRNLDGSDFEPGKLCVAAAIDGNLEYDVRDPKTTRLTTIHKETFQEGLIKLSHEDYFYPNQEEHSNGPS